MKQNTMLLRFDALSQNEAFARVTVGAFFSQLNPTLEELADVKTAVSEAVTNAVIHGYCQKGGTVEIECTLTGQAMTVSVADCGIGMKDVERAMQPFFSTGPEEERSGMGFMVMQAFMDDLLVESTPGAGTKVTMKKAVQGERDASRPG
jgi:stage II sporulation protein AB (anti-sigma F factor)